MEDIELVDKAKQGDQDAYTALYNKHYSKTLGFVSRLSVTAPQHEKEDLAQGAIATALLKLHLFDGNAKFTTWLYKVTRNYVYMQHRNKRNKPLDHAEAMEVTTDDGEVLQVDVAVEDTGYRDFEVRHDLHTVLDQLEDNHVETLTDRYIDNKSHIQVAEEQGITVAASKSRQYHAMERAQSLMTSIQNSPHVFQPKKCICCDELYTPTSYAQKYAVGHAATALARKHKQRALVQPKLKESNNEMVTITIPVSILDKLWHTRTPQEKARAAEILLAQFV